MDEIRFYRATGKYDFLSNLYRRRILFPDHAFIDDGKVPTTSDDDPLSTSCIKVRGDDNVLRIMFRSSEDAYQYGKPRRRAVAEWLVSSPSPHLCALAAHALLGYDVVSGWRTAKIERMRQVLGAKFGLHEDLRAQLIATGDAILIEESNIDAFWGIGAKGNGQNMLGQLLMETREWCRGRPAA